MKKLKGIWDNPIARFLLIFGGSFALLFYFNEFYIGITASGGRFYSELLDTHLNYVSGLRHFLLQTAEWILMQLGYTTFTTNYWLRVSGHGGIIVVYSCLGFGVMSFFTAFVLAWPKPIKNKLWFLPIGLIVIQSLNIMRFILLSLFWKGSLLKGFIDHHDLFNIILYILLLGIIYFWVKDDKINAEG